MTLDQIRARAMYCRNHNFGTWSADKLAHEDSFRLLAAVDAVLALADAIDAADDCLTPNKQIPPIIREAITRALDTK